jgi:hypothetical protein
MAKVRSSIELPTEMIEYGLAELKAWRRNDRTTCAILKHDGKPYIILRCASKIVALDEAGHVWKTWT